MADRSDANRVVLIAAIVCGLTAAGMAFVYLSANTTSREPEPTVDILVASRDLALGHVLSSEEDVETMAVPMSLSDLIDRSLTPEYLLQIDGRRSNRPILAGTPIMFADLVGTSQLEIEDGYFALSIPAAGANAVSGLLAPGDYVKLLVTRPVPKERAPPSAGATPEALLAEALSGEGAETTEWETVTVSTDLFKVLAVDRRVSAPNREYDTLFLSETGEAEGYTTVTLQVTEPQATMILAESGAGELPITLLMAPRQ